MIDEKICRSVDETENVGYEFAKLLCAGDFVAMRGDLGAGKTAFVRGVAKFLCPQARVCSPTYAIVNTYRGNITIYHFDMYRIESEESLYSTGFFDYLDDDAVCIAEWSEKIEDFIPVGAYFVSIDKLSENERKVTISKE
ncbi:MAG: tRNA (adenosine(37)-N6)-threonylcarbamoyltransferase complex ATPase subunit type 1 TsaE [Clostridia bacterium]|nr:tRNA (adenosine(37)-N6)-threonylcarbamoyltransferase complex ATPase subunit type 1 TsaE [Clostridia bacterium]